ncbi:MAG: SDR family oxidoreductase [Bacteroidia bacterium]|jgi:short-subunit dehydrogenase|nr:SDR family oxidoreductase [Bacteroidia bacterium]
MSFANKVVWITGASSGIGEALAVEFARQGATLVLSSRRQTELERVQQACGLGADRCLILPLDLADTSEVDALTQQVVKTFGRIDVLVNNGGISQRALAKDAPVEIDRRIMEVNFFGQIALTKSVLPVMLAQRSGHIVVMSSIAGKFGFWYRTAYSASKHALHGFFESLRMEVEGEGLQVLIACPGKIRTDISLHALRPDGTAHNVMDKSQELGMPADECARQIIVAMKKGKEEVLIGGREIKAVWIKRHFPGLFAKIIRKQPKE